MSDTKTLLPVYHKNAGNIRRMFESNSFMFRVPFYRVGWMTLCLSLFSFLFCVFWSILFNFEEANATHCSVENFLPSLSAAIGHFYPQTYVWSLATLVQMIPRLKISTMYLNYYNAVILDKFSNLFHLAYMCHTCELWCLLGLSLVTSTANYPFHAFCFTCFLFSSILYMVLSCYLLQFKRKIPPGNVESRTLKWKFKFCLLNIFCFLMAGYFFRRHNMYCEPRVYSLFAFFEYGVVLSNMFFHVLSVWDFYDKTITLAITSRGVEVSYSPPFKSNQKETGTINLLIIIMLIIFIIFTTTVGAL